MITAFCLPCAGASAQSFLGWRRRLASQLLIEPIELPGRGTRADEPCFRRFAPLAELLASEIGRARPARYILLGHSMGALLAYACAHRLSLGDGPSPLALVVLACAAPSQRPEPRNFGSREAVVAELRRLGGVPEDLFSDPEILEHVLTVFGADLAVCDDFRETEWQGPLDLPILAFGGRRDDIPKQALNDWRLATTRACSVEMIDGAHFFPRTHTPQFLSALEDSLQIIVPAHTGDVTPKLR